MTTSCIINSRKHDGTIHRSWSAELIERSDTLLVFLGEFGREVRHPDIGVIRRGTVSYEYYWLDRWFNVFRFHEPEGGFRCFYCNVNLPPEFRDGVLDYVDLDIDILVQPDFSHRVLDLEEFELHADLYGYPPEIRRKALETADAIIAMLGRNEFPFNDVPIQSP